MNTDRIFMQVALEEALKAREKGEVPVGAVIVHDGNLIVRAHNMRETLNDPTAHAEMLAIREASRLLGRWRLSNCELFVTKEPCPMCAGAVINARLDRVVFGCTDEKGGAGGSLYNILSGEGLNHRPVVVQGIMEEEAAGLLRDFFLRKRRGGRVV